ncbi:MAG: hydantoinase/carbamoylase family amidase, partial [Thermomicrobiales bacterium]|nr:hydantoinase/carbamoylase family amidase [Thermomicrobiales bacterium]
MKTDARVQIDPARVERAIWRMAEFGADGETGVSRTVYSPEWIGATQELGAWLQAAGLRVTHDAVGNVWGRLDGTGGGKAIVTGSHIDSQTPGGRYDGALGIIAGYIAVTALNEQFGLPQRPIEVLAFCEEEGSRFPDARFWGSQAITGLLTPERAEEVRGFAGESIGDAMRAIGLDPALVATARRDDIDTFIELHIEQGPILEHAGVPVAIVHAITGIRHATVTLHGTANHAGAFPMDLRRDPMAAAAEIISGVIDTAHRMGRPAVTTVGRMVAEPNFPAIIPECVQ